MIKELQGLLTFAGVSENGSSKYPYGEELAKSLDYVLELCDSFGFKTKNHDYQYGYAEIGSGKEILGILVHLDVVEAGDGWDTPPFSGVVADDKIFGRGSVDDKGPAIASIYAMKELNESGIPLNKRIRIIFGQSEETGDWDDIALYCKNEEPVTCGYVPDACFPVVCGEKGIVIASVSMPLSESGIKSISGGTAPNIVPEKCSAEIFDAEGSVQILETAGVAAHGSTPWEGKNAITLMMAKVEEQFPGASRFAEAYNKLVGQAFHGEKCGSGIEDAESGKLSMNAGVIECIEDRLVLTLDIRFPVTYSSSDVLSRLKTSFGEYGLSVEGRYCVEPMYVDCNSDFIRALVDAYETVTGEHASPVVLGGGTYAKAMKNLVAFGPEFPGKPNNEHQSNEYVLIDDLNTMKNIYRTALERLLKI